LAEILNHAMTEGFEVQIGPEEDELVMVKPKVIAMCSDGRGVEKLHDMQKFPSLYGCPHCWTRGYYIPNWKMIYPGFYVQALQYSS